MSPRPHPALIGKQEGLVTVAHVFGVQQFPLSQNEGEAPHAVELQVIGSPEQGSIQVPHTPAGQVVGTVQHVALSAFEHCWPPVQFPKQLTDVPLH